MLVLLSGTPTWRPDINENPWNSLLLWERLFFPRDLVCIHIKPSPNALTVQIAISHKIRPFFRRDNLVSAPSWCHVWRKSRKFKLLDFKNKGCYRDGILWKDICLVVTSTDDDKNLADPVSFDFMTSRENQQFEQVWFVMPNWIQIIEKKSQSLVAFALI